ncbi:MAG: glycosyltransferase family 2 protein [Rhizobiaceae bacterium]
MGEWPEQDGRASKSDYSRRNFDLSGDPPYLIIDNDENHKDALPADIAFLQSMNISREILVGIARLSRRKGIPASEILIARGIISRQEYLAYLSDALGAELLTATPNTENVRIPPEDEKPSHKTALFFFPKALHFLDHGRLRLVINPEGGAAARLLKAMGANPFSSRNVLLATGTRLRRLWFDATKSRMALQAREYLARNYCDYSAMQRITPLQSAALVALLFLMGTCLYLFSQVTLFAMTVFFSVFYFAIICLRIILICHLDEIPVEDVSVNCSKATDPEDYSLYSIMVALYQEAAGVDELIASLERIDWPNEKREVFLICEEDDHETIAAIQQNSLPQGFQFVACPYSLPRTKPKALNFVLPLCAGEFTVIYDAEDQPDPGQLQEAWHKFSRSGRNVACLQAPLLIHNARQNWLTAMFGLEYETLFLGMLPIFSRLGAPLPLGGTSNHFRTSALKSAGGWDPYNVTEDADLGIRLSRMGYKCGTITRPTWEEAPPLLGIWTKQRTRWLKGWIQTLLVHTRNPVRTGRNLGWRANMYFHLLLTSIVISTLIHPIFLAQAGYYLATVSDLQRPDAYQLGLLGLSMFNLAGGYTTHGFLAYGVIKRHKSARSSPKLLLFLPIYWLLISFAGWRAVWHMFTRPFDWEKTTHGLANDHANANMK